MCSVEDVVSGVVQAVGAAIEWREISITKAEAKYKAESLMKEANVAQEQAGIERQEGIETAREKRLQSILNMGEIKTSSAFGNISISSQNTLDLIESEKINVELDALNTLVEAEKSSDSYLQKADKLYSQAQLQFYEANNKLPYLKLFGKAADKTAKNVKKWRAKLNTSPTTEIHLGGKNEQV